MTALDQTYHVNHCAALLAATHLSELKTSSRLTSPARADTAIFSFAFSGHFSRLANRHARTRVWSSYQGYSARSCSLFSMPMENTLLGALPDQREAHPGIFLPSHDLRQIV